MATRLTGDRLNQRQYRFLREMRRDPAGLATYMWPNITRLRSWLRKPRFVAAMQTLREVMRFEADLMLAASASQAAKSLQRLMAEQDPTSGAFDMEKRTASWVRVIRAEHQRQKESRPSRATQPSPLPGRAPATALPPTTTLAARRTERLTEIWSTFDRLLAEADKNDTPPVATGLANVSSEAPRVTASPKLESPRQIDSPTAPESSHPGLPCEGPAGEEVR